MASLTSLPTDVFRCIVQVMADDECEGSLAALAGTCRGFHTLVMPRLYHWSVVDRHPFLIYWAALFGLVSTAKRLVVDGDVCVDLAMQWSRSRSDSEGLQNFCSQKTPRQVYQAFQTRGGNTLWERPAPQRTYWYPIHLAVMSGSVEMVEFLIRQSPKQITAPSYRLCECSSALLRRFDTKRDELMHSSLLHIASCHKRTDVFRWLVENDMDASPRVRLNVGETRGHCSALHHAARFGLVDMIRFILDGGYETDVHVLDSRQLSPIWHAYLHGQWEAVDLLLERGADIDDDVGYGYTPLVDACLCRNFMGAPELIDRGANVDVEYYDSPNPISACVNIPHASRLRPIDICCRRTCEDRRFLDEGVTSDPVSQSWVPGKSKEWDDYNMVESRRRAVVSKLLAAGADFGPGQAALLGQGLPMVQAAANHLPGIVDELIKHGAPVNSPDRNGVSPLVATLGYTYSSCPFHFQRWDSFTEWTAFAANPKHRNHPKYHGKRDPYQAGCPELRACVNLLVQNGADVNQVDANGNAPLSLLCVSPCFRAFFGHSRQDLVWITPSDKARLTPLFLRHGANPEAKMTPISDNDPHAYQDNNKLVPTAQWGSGNWPLTAMQHAYWDADFELCQQLLEAGATPDQSTICWMIWVMLRDVKKGKEDPLTQETLDFIHKMPPELLSSAYRNPLCLALALKIEWFELAKTICDPGLELCQFSEKVQGNHWDFTDRCDEKSVELGMLCVQEAVRANATSILEGLLELGVKTIPNNALMHAIRNKNLTILERLVQHGATVHIKDKETDSEGYRHHSNYRGWGYVSPMKLAIMQSCHDSIGVMLRESQGVVDPWYRFYYLKEAYTRLQPATVACLLEHPSIHLNETDLTDTTDLPLAHLVRDAEKICAAFCWVADAFGPKSRLENGSRWVACVAAFAQAGVDPGMRDKAGKSALDYLKGHMAYVGLDRFKNHIAAQLRAQLSQEEIDDGLDPLACYEALKKFKIEP